MVGKGIKALLLLGFLGASIIGFMVKLPSSFRQIDKELHSVFYFLAAAFLNILFAKRSIIKHALIFGLLYLFGIGIEYAQEYSNTLLRQRIHGRFDPEDLAANLKGIVAFSVLWIIYLGVMLIVPKPAAKSAK